MSLEANNATDSRRRRLCRVKVMRVRLCALGKAVCSCLTYTTKIMMMIIVVMIIIIKYFLPLLILLSSLNITIVLIHLLIFFIGSFINQNIISIKYSESL